MLVVLFLTGFLAIINNAKVNILDKKIGFVG